jgi:hypothetical protein
VALPAALAARKCNEGSRWANPNAKFEQPARWVTHEVSENPPFLIPFPTWDTPPQKNKRQ